MNNLPFIRGEPQRVKSPLNDCLPAYRSGIVQRWLNENYPNPGVILLPFGNSPQVALEAARAGYRVILPAHNPILRFMVEALADPPAEEELRSVLAKLGSSYKGKERLKPFIQSLYETECPGCGSRISANSYIWSRLAKEPVEKVCQCTNCGETNRSPVTANDVQAALQYQENSPVHARALTRVASPSDPIRSQVESALISYPPRTVYALFSVLNRLTGLNLPPRENRLVEMLLLQTFHSTSPIRSTQEGDQEPGDEFIEENVWLKLEESVEVWTADDGPTEVTTWPDLPSSGGVAIYPGRIRELITQIGDLDLQSLVLVFPKPTPSFWALSALWTGWLWGQDAAAPLRGILTIKNFDWVWMTRAVDLTLSDLYQILPSGTGCFGLLPDLTRDYLISGISAARSAGFDLVGIALESDQSLAETSWVSRKGIFSKQALPDIRALIRQAGYELLKVSGEPRDTHSLISAGLYRIVEEGYPPVELSAEDYYPTLIKDFEDNLAYRQGFLGFMDGQKWWHQDFETSLSPKADQLEREIVQLLVGAQEPIGEAEIFSQVFDIFPGLLTPDESLILTCLKSYASPLPGTPTQWVLNAGEKPERRHQDLSEIDRSLSEIGGNLGYEISREESSSAIIHQRWMRNGNPEYSFLISASGLLGKIIQEANTATQRRWMILPGSRAGLVHYKLEQNPPLSEIVRSSWGLVKFRQIRRLAETGGLNEANFIEHLKLDPFESDSPQLTLI